MDTNSADCARMPGARKSRYRTPPVGIARIRLNVSPNTSSHSAGWIARVISSVRSRRSFCSSTRHIAPARETRTRSALTEPAYGPASGADVTEPSCLQVVAGVGAEHVVQRAAADRGDQLLGGTLGADPAAVHERDPVAVLLRLLH